MDYFAEVVAGQAVAGLNWRRVRPSPSRVRYYPYTSPGADPVACRGFSWALSVGAIVSRGDGVGRALTFHFLGDTLDGARPNLGFSGDLENALSGLQMPLDTLLNSRIDLRPSELLALLYGPLKLGVDSLADHAALELGKSSADKRSIRHDCRRSLRAR